MPMEQLRDRLNPEGEAPRSAGLQGDVRLLDWTGSHRGPRTHQRSVFTKPLPLNPNPVYEGLVSYVQNGPVWCWLQNGDGCGVTDAR
uniref:Uncharacterized protein n=1 Tax=Knipowitschia caucasica TaxID=637954 RepID=A0AAV2K7B4_KNICA